MFVITQVKCVAYKVKVELSLYGPWRYVWKWRHISTHS